MFRKTNPQQCLFGVDSSLAQRMRVRLKNSWAEVFRMEILRILLEAEESFSILYGTTGRPNFSVGRMLGLCLLQELCAFNDQEALDAFGFDARWQYALDVNVDEEAYLSRRSLVEFRRRLVDKDPEMTLMRGIFNQISDAAIDKLGLSVREQRLDSTHVASNIHTHGRIDLFQSTIKLFIRSLSDLNYKGLPEDIREWFEKEADGWFGLGSKEQKKEKLHRLASFLLRLIGLFEKDKAVNTGEAYQLLVRLFSEHCELKEPEDLTQKQTSSDKPVFLGNSESDTGDESLNSDSKSDDDTGGYIQANADESDDVNKSCRKDRDKEPEVHIKKNNSGETLQSPHDPDASYGHKGVGYSVQICETCNNKETPEIITTYEVHGAARSDKGKAVDMVEQLNDTSRKPDSLYIDGGYPTVPSVPKVLAYGVDFVGLVDRGPMSDDVMGRDRFEFDEQGYVTKCPDGHGPIDHRILSNGADRTLHAVFDGDTCRGCDLLDKCPVRAPNHRKKGESPRDTVGDFRLEITLELRLRDEMYAAQQTEEWKERYKIRAGVEATMSELKGCHALGKLRVRGLSRVHFAVVCKVIACNIRRWTRGIIAKNTLSPSGQAVLSSHFVLNALKHLTCEFTEAILAA